MILASVMVWVLFIVVTDTNGRHERQIADPYDTADECVKEGLRIGAEMEKSYPNEMRNWDIECRAFKMKDKTT